MKVFKLICSTILSILIMCLLFIVGIVFMVQNSIKGDSLSSMIQDIDFTSFVYDDDDQLTEVGEEINKVFKQMGFSVKETREILKTPTLKKVMGDFIGTSIESAMDENIEVKYPSKNDMKNIVDECYDIAKNNDKVAISKEEAIEKIDKEYDEVVSNLKEYSKDISSNLNIDDTIDFGKKVSSKKEDIKQMPIKVNGGGR